MVRASVVAILGVVAWGQGMWTVARAQGGPGETDKAYHYSNVGVEAEAAVRRAASAGGAVPRWGRFEVVVRNGKRYANPYEDVTLDATFTKPDGKVVTFWGFYDGGDTWRVRFMPDQMGTWRYRARFSDGTRQVSGTFTCVASDIPGMISRHQDNPIWFGYKGGEAVLVRSFHVGDRFFADKGNALTGEPWSPGRREAFLDWAQDQGYNMLSIASHYLNRDKKGRGKGWETPNLWDAEKQRPNWDAYRKVEVILDDLAARRIMVYPFAGFFGRDSHFPRDAAEQDVYLRYTLARLGPYWNIVLMVGGPEPRLRGKPYLEVEEINKLGRKIKALDPFGHLVSVHNMTGPDAFKDENWTDYGILQGPKTTDREKLSEGLLASHHAAKPLYAQETLWPGNKYHPDYPPTAIRKNAYVMLMSAAMINYADMNGDSSSGFSGSMDLGQKVQQRHNIIKRVWDFFEDVSFWRMRPRQDLVDNGYCLAEPGKRYLVYLERPGKVNVLVEGGPYQVRWIEARNTEHVHAGGVTHARRALVCPEGGDDWLLSLTLSETSVDRAKAPKAVGKGTFPDIQVDGDGDLHLVYGRDGCVHYRRYDARRRRWGAEQFTGIAEVPWLARSEPDVVVDSRNRPHVFAGSEYARLAGGAWKRMKLGEKLRDTELAIDASDNLYLVHRGGNHGGYMGLRVLRPDAEAWVSLPDPDRPLLGRNDHVYPDLAVSPVDQSLHIVYRHGNPKKTAYRRSTDGGQSWPIREGITDNEPEAAHIVVDGENNVYVTDGGGNFFCRADDEWVRRGRPVIVPYRGQPELAVDRKGNLYCTCWGGRYNVRVKGRWTGRRRLRPLTSRGVIGFVEPIGAKDFAYVVWEEGSSGNPDKGMAAGGVVVVGRLLPDGTVRGL